MFSLAGKNAFITGGTAGIGLAVAKGFVEAGSQVVIAGVSVQLLERALGSEPS